LKITSEEFETERLMIESIVNQLKVVCRHESYWRISSVSGCIIDAEASHPQVEGLRFHFSYRERTQSHPTCSQKTMKIQVAGDAAVQYYDAILQLGNQSRLSFLLIHGTKVLPGFAIR
jgi:hypothetical protein